MEWRIFLYHVRPDRRKVKELHNCLSRAGYQVWMGSPYGWFPRRRSQQIAPGCEVLLVCVSTNLLSEGKLTEAAEDLLRHWQLKNSAGRIIVVKLEACEVPVPLEHYATITYSEEDDQSFVDRVIFLTKLEEFVNPMTPPSYVEEASTDVDCSVAESRRNSNPETAKPENSGMLPPVGASRQTPVPPDTPNDIDNLEDEEALPDVMLAIDVEDETTTSFRHEPTVRYHRSDAGGSPISACAPGMLHTTPTANDVPLAQGNQPLPHDGLFVRRNNAFGTKPTGGIKELIENGVMIEQTNIRFDDFVAPNHARVPSPPAGHAIAVSHGLADIRSEQKYHDGTTHYLEIAIKAAQDAPNKLSSNAALPVNYMFIVDTSASMFGEKLETVKASIRELFGNMREDDIIGITTFNTSVATVLKSTPKKNLDLGDFGRVVSQMRADGGTDINLGLLYGLDEIGRYSSHHSIDSIYLFSDGNPTSGETNWLKIRQHVANRARGSISLSVFGFGSDANMRELEALAGATGGHSVFVTHPDDVRSNLQENLDRRDVLVAMNLQVQIEIDRDITILHLYGHDHITDPASRKAVLQDVQDARRQARKQFDIESQPDLITEEKGIRIFAPDLAAGETYWVVLELAIPEGRTSADVGRATVQHVDILAHQNQTHELVLTANGALDADLVIEHGLGLWTSEIVFYTLDDLYQSDLETATMRLEMHRKRLQTANQNLKSSQLADDTITLGKLSTLSQNLGKPMRSIDDRHSSAHEFTVHALNYFGRVKNGFLMANYKSPFQV